MGLFRSHQHDHSHIDRSAGRNKRENTRRFSGGDYDASQAPKRWNGKIVDRKASADKMKIERAMRRRSR